MWRTRRGMMLVATVVVAIAVTTATLYRGATEHHYSRAVHASTDLFRLSFERTDDWFVVTVQNRSDHSLDLPPKLSYLAANGNLKLEFIDSRGAPLIALPRIIYDSTSLGNRKFWKSVKAGENVLLRFSKREAEESFQIDGTPVAARISYFPPDQVYVNAQAPAVTTTYLTWK